MKPESRKNDNIDNELIETYFRPGTKKQFQERPRPAAGKNSNGPSKSFNLSFVLIAGILAVLIALLMSPGEKPARSAVRARPIYKVSSPVDPIRVRNEKVLYDFSLDAEGWIIPAWASEQPDHIAESVSVSYDIALLGDRSLKVVSSFPGGYWTASLVEISHYLDLRKYDVILMDVYLPPDAPEGLRAKMILTVKDNWDFVEMSRSIRLVPGEWTNIAASLKKDSIDWKRTKVDEEFKSDVRKIALRVESDKRPVYSGPFYLDNIRVGNLDDR